MRKTTTWYLHTLDGRPASYDDSRGPYIYFVGGRHPAKLVPTLRQLRREQKAAQAVYAERHVVSDDPWRYGYVLVEVPA